MISIKKIMVFSVIVFSFFSEAQYENQIRQVDELIRAVHKKNPADLKRILHDAVVRGKRDPEWFINYMAFPDSGGWTSFMHAVEIGDTSRMSLFLDAFEEALASNPKGIFKIVSVEDLHGRTALRLAAERRLDPPVVTLLDHYMKVFGKDKKAFFELLNNRDQHLGWTPLMAATYDGAHVMMRIIMDAAVKVLGKDSAYYNEFINARGSLGNTAVLLSIDPRDRWLLLQYGARDDVALQDPLSKQLNLLGTQLLHYTSHEGHEKNLEEFFEMLGKKFPNNYQVFLDVLTTRDEGGWTALMNAAANGYEEYVRILLKGAYNLFKTDKVPVSTPGREHEEPADKEWLSIIFNNADIHGRAAIHLAIARRHIDVLKAIFEYEQKYLGSQVRTFNRFIDSRTELNGFTPLLLASYRSSDDELSYDMIRMIVERARAVLGRDSIDFDRVMNARDWDKQTPLSYAISPKIRDYLIKNGSK